MRLAVVIVGEPRHYRITTQALRKNIVDKLRADGHQVDVLVACWATRMVAGTLPFRVNIVTNRDSTPRARDYLEHAEIVRMLGPLSYMFTEKPRVDVAWFVSHFGTNVNVYGMFCQHASWRLAASLVTTMEQTYGVQYDGILRTRLDNHFLHPIVLPELHTIQLPRVEGFDVAPFDVNIYANDQFAVGPRLLMLQSLNICNDYEYMAKLQPHYGLPEQLVWHHLHRVLHCGFEVFPLTYRVQRGDYVPP